MQNSMQTEFEALSMREALLLWVKTQAILAKLAFEEEDEDVSALTRSLALFEAELFQQTHPFLQSAFNTLHIAVPTSESLAAGLAKFLNLPHARRMHPSTPVFPLEIHEEMTLSALYRMNMARAKERLKASNQYNNNNAIPLFEKEKYDTQLNQIELSYLSLPITSHHPASLRQLTHKLINQNASLQPFSHLYAAFGEIIKIGEIAQKMCFAVEEAARLCKKLQKCIKENISPNSPINISLPKVMTSLPLLKPFFNITGNDFFSLTDPDNSLPGLLLNTMQTGEFNAVLTGLSTIIPHYLNVIKLLNYLKEKLPPTHELKNVLDSIHDRLSYQITRPSRLLLVLREINKNLIQLQTVGLLTLEESEQAEQFSRKIDDLARGQLATNDYQIALEAQVQISVYLRKPNAPFVSKVLGGDLQKNHVKPHEDELQAVKNYFDQLLTNKQDADQFKDYGAIAQAIKTILSKHNLHIETLSTADRKKDVSLKLLYDIFKTYHEKAQAVLNASAIQMSEQPNMQEATQLLNYPWKSENILIGADNAQKRQDDGLSVISMVDNEPVNDLLLQDEQAERYVQEDIDSNFLPEGFEPSLTSFGFFGHSSDDSNDKVNPLAPQANNNNNNANVR
ncbi:MAG: hypothetical protein K2Q14_01685 [Gammaproteobacteria bacterium]|nr:hypothetical protein [Gammaproteobacteria bacterium]